MKKIILVSLLSLFFIPLFANASLDTNLYYGLQNNSDVRQLQEFLIDKGYLSGNSTGNFFSLTLNAVKQYQKSQKISQTGYVGILTRGAINNELATNLSASNQEATNETGTTPPAPILPATTNDVVATLQAQIALLLQQVQAMQAQQTTTQQLQQTVQQQAQTIQQIQQNTQQIVQNTCTPNWQCISWSACSSSTQTRTCTDSNNCGNNNGRPALTQSCSMPTPVATCNLVGQQVGNLGKVTWTSSGADSGELLYQHGNNAGTPFESHLWDVGRSYVINGQDSGNTISSGWFGGFSIPVTIHGVFHNSSGNTDCYATVTSQTIPDPVATLSNSISTIALTGDYSYPNYPVIATLNVAVSGIDQPLRFMAANYSIISNDFTKGVDLGTLWFYIGNAYTGRTLSSAEQQEMTIQPGQSKNVDIKVGQDGFFSHGGTFSVHLTSLIFSGKTIPVDITIPNISVQ